MPLQYKIAEQVLHVDDASEVTQAIVHKYDAFLNLLCAEHYAFQRDAIRAALRFLVSDKYPDLERLARENWNARPAIRQRHDNNLDSYLEKMPLRDRKAVSLELATGAGKSFVMYGLAAIALAEGLVERVLVLCPSLTIEEGLLEKFSTLAGNGALSAILMELGAVHTPPGIKRGNTTVQAGDICIENIHAVYENAGSSIADSFKGSGPRTLVLNDEAHHLFSPQEMGLKEWLRFLVHDDYAFRYIVNVTGTAYLAKHYFPEVIYRYGLKQAIADQVVKKPNYKLEDTYAVNDWQKTYAIHRENQKTYGSKVRPISIVVTQEIVRCVEVWRVLVDFLVSRESISRESAEKKVLWVTSGVPSRADEKTRIEAAYGARNDKDSPEKRRKENLALLKQVDEPDSPVEWIVSVSMLTEGWDVKNVFQIVPHDERAFNSRLLIAQVLGRGLRIPPGMLQPLVTINNHEKWQDEIRDLLVEVLEVESMLTWGYDPRRKAFAFPLHNLSYEIEQTTTEVKRVQAREPDINFRPQSRRTVEHSTFVETGQLAIEIEHKNLIELDGAVAHVRAFLREKDETLAANWPKKRLRDLIVAQLKEAGQDSSFLSKENLLQLQYAFSPMFRQLGKQHPRMSQVAKELVHVDLTQIRGQSFSESTLKEHGWLWYVKEEPPTYSGTEQGLWDKYQRLKEQLDHDVEIASDEAKSIAPKLKPVTRQQFKSPWNIHYASHEPERRFSEQLFANADLFDSFAKMPDQGFYSFPYSYKPSGAAKTHTANESFNPDYFLRVAGTTHILAVEIKADGDDSNRNKAKFRDGRKHFELLNLRLAEAREPWRYYFLFLSPDDYSYFFQSLRNKDYPKWQSSLMSELS